MSRELVVAHYGEDLSWLRDASAWQVRVYSKQNGELPNVGREAHTYLHHIVERYDELADVTAFLQGSPVDHVADLSERLRTPERLADFAEWGTRLVVDDLSRRLSHRGLNLAGCHRELFGTEPPQRFAFHAGACFSVTRDLIRRRARNFYKRALRWSIESPGGPWELERIWPLIFGELPLCNE